MYFHSFRSIFTLLLLNLSSSSAIEGARYNERGLMIRSANCNGRAYPFDIIFYAVIAGTQALSKANDEGYLSSMPTYTPSEGEHMGIDGRYYVYPIWSDNPNTFAVKEKDVVIFTIEQKLVKVATYSQKNNPNRTSSRWIYKDCDLDLVVNE
ncbi:hypothetical protein HI914_04634 [Erysiphe necator]|nr:hypothetical protein HI914_04634 [Erysiphe necator]